MRFLADIFRQFSRSRIEVDHGSPRRFDGNPSQAASEASTPPVVPINERISLVNGLEGTFLTLNRDTGVSQEIRETGAWAHEDVGLFKRLLRAGMHVADIGANLGHHTVVFSKCVGPTGSVIACEPQRILFQLLNANLALNGCKNVEAQRCAVGETRGMIKLWPTDYEKPDNFGALSLSKHLGEFRLEHGGEDVRMLTTDDLLLEHAERHGGLSFIKLDVQAYELFCLQGAKETIARYRPSIFLELSPHWMKRMGYDYMDVYRFLENAGYRILEPHESMENPAKVRVWSGDEQATWDILAVPS